MKVQQIQPNINFESNKRRYIGSESYQQLEQILHQMDNETVYKSNEYSFQSTKTTRLSLMDNKTKKAELIDTRNKLDKIPTEKQMQENTLLTIGKTELVIDNKSGEIIDYYKPFFTCWKKVLKKIQTTLGAINSSYNNSNIVQKHKLTVEGFTKKGFEVLSRIKVK